MLPSNTVSIQPALLTTPPEGVFGIGHFTLDMDGIRLEFAAWTSNLDHAARNVPDPLRVWLSAHTNTQDGSVAWYAFFSAEARKLFLQLVDGVEGWGPKTAATFIGNNGHAAIAAAVAAGDTAAIGKFKGVGPKALPKVLECLMKDRPVKASAPPPKPVNADAVAALTTLGYKKPAAETLIRDLMAQHPQAPTEELVKAALRLPRPA